MTEIERLRAENERLRAALLQVVAADPMGRVIELVRIARAAL